MKPINESSKIAPLVLIETKTAHGKVKNTDHVIADPHPVDLLLLGCWVCPFYQRDAKKIHSWTWACTERMQCGVLCDQL